MENECSLSRRCPSFDGFIEEKAGFEKLHGRSLESCSQVLVGTFVESLRLPAFTASNIMTICNLDQNGKASSQHLEESLDPLYQSRRLAVEMCESLLEDINPVCLSSPHEAEFIYTTVDQVPFSSWNLCTDFDPYGYELNYLGAFAPLLILHQ